MKTRMDIIEDFLKTNPTKGEFLEYYFKRICLDKKRMLLISKFCPLDVLDYFYNNPNVDKFIDGETILSYVLMNPICPIEFINDALARFGTKYLDVIVCNPNCPLELIEAMVHNKDFYVLKYVNARKRQQKNKAIDNSRKYKEEGLKSYSWLMILISCYGNCSEELRELARTNHDNARWESLKIKV